MKTTFTQNLCSFVLTILSFASIAQCPTVTNMSVTMGANGTATVSTILSGSPNYGAFWYYWTETPNATQTSQTVSQTESSVGYQFPANGSYTINVFINDSISGCSSSGSTVVTISNLSANSCGASFYFYTDSATCVTNFVNTSVGSNLTSNWIINGVPYSTASPTVSLPDGYYYAYLTVSSAGTACDSTYQGIVINCSGNFTNSACQSSFYTYTDSNCVTNFISTSVNSGMETWSIDGINVGTVFNPSYSLSNGSHTVTLYSYTPIGALCDSSTQILNISCSSGTVSPIGCQSNPQFLLFADSINTGNYYAYNYSWSTGTTSYLWDFGDGTTSTLANPIHQYLIPGQYIVCLTVTGTYTNALGVATTCSNTYCDSSSVHRIASGFQMSKISILPPPIVTSLNTTLTSNIGLLAYPNPFKDELTIEVKSTNISQLQIILIDALGREVLKETLQNERTKINTSNLPQGVYGLNLLSKEGQNIKSIKLIK